MKIKDLIIFVVLCISICGNVAFFMADGITYFRLKDLNEKNGARYPICSSREEFRKEIFDVNMDILMSGNRPEAPIFPSGVIDRIKYNLGKKKSYPFFYWGEPNWLLTATLEDAILHKDKEHIREIAEVFKDNINNQPIEHVDQCQCGSAAILLHQGTGDNIYKSYADMVFEWCKNNNTEYGILYAKRNTAQVLDGYGMCLPFLQRYAQVYNDSIALNLVVRHIELAAKYFIDETGGLPVHRYSLSFPHIKQGNCNWGRGVSWFVSGLTDIDYSLLSDSTIAQLDKMDSALLAIWKKNGKFNQFLGEQGEIDLSATLPIIYYLSRKGLIKLTEKDLLSFCRYSDNGLLYNSSPSNTGSYAFGMTFGPNVLSQAFMLKLLNEVK